MEEVWSVVYNSGYKHLASSRPSVEISTMC